ncbi:hypothetical protein NLJ89_g30 [Agrocybe chaxingu]|uniref:HIT domain-containing protein n=1 Tax=Agrocybe chaxingu TaxID=84603 RepID=A0A9W8N2U6_9AGAR|nr:hypothetical protein NLJ89_g30 [Agrocybe chaxingu]
MHELPDEYLADILPIAKKIAISQGTPDYNILQNNGRIAHQVALYPIAAQHLVTSLQEVPHVHFHIIPKPSTEEGLGIGWPTKAMDKEELKQIFNEMKAKLSEIPDPTL